MFRGCSIVTIAQTSQLLQLVLNSALMMVIALMWWGVVVFRFNTVSSHIQRNRRQYRLIKADEGSQNVLLRLRQYRHELTVRYRLTRHSALIMHYVLLVLMTSLFCLSLRALININLLITVALFLFVLGAAGILLSVALALMEFYQINVLTIPHPDWDKAEPMPSAMMAVAPQYQIAPPGQGGRGAKQRVHGQQKRAKDHAVGTIAS
jgi:hypothetical protein